MMIIGIRESLSRKKERKKERKGKRNKFIYLHIKLHVISIKLVVVIVEKIMSLQSKFSNNSVKLIN